jgi:hypothetical protein
MSLTSGELYVAGGTSSTDFPATAGGAQPTMGGGSPPAVKDAFVARLNADLTVLRQSTYLGGREFDFAEALAIHPTTGEVYIAGYTVSTNFPATAGGAQAALSGPQDAFVARLTSDLVGVEPTPTPTATNAPTNTPTSTPTNPPTPVPGLPTLNESGMLIFGLLIAAGGLLLIVRRR